MSLARNVATVGGATLVSRLLGFARDVGVAALLGASPAADAYVAALQIPNLFRRLVADGALNAAFVPSWLRARDTAEEDGARRFAGHALGTLTLALGVLTLATIVFAPAVIAAVAPGFAADGERAGLAASFLRLAAPYVFLAGVIAVVAAMLNAQGRVAAAAAGVVAFNLVALAALALVIPMAGDAGTAGAWLAASFAIAGLVQIAVVGGAAMTACAMPRIVSVVPTPEVRRFLALALPGAIAAGIPQVTLIAGSVVASSSPSAVAWLYYANRLYELPLGVASIVLSAAMVPLIAIAVRAGEGVAAAQSRALEIGLGLALPAAAALALLAPEIAGALFERGSFTAQDTAMVAAALAAIAAGLPGHVLEKALAAVSFAHEDTRTPMSAALAGLAAALAGAVILFPHYGHVGIAGAIAGAGWIGAALLAAVLWRRRWLAIEAAAGRRLAGIAAATLVMALALAGARELVAAFAGPSTLARMAVLATLVALGLAVYAAAIQALGVASLRVLARSLTGSKYDDAGDAAKLY